MKKFLVLAIFTSMFLAGCDGIDDQKVTAEKRQNQEMGLVYLSLSTRIDYLQLQITNLQTQLGNLQTTINNLQGGGVSQQQLTDAINNLKAFLLTLINSGDSNLQVQIDVINQRISAINAVIAIIQLDIANLKNFDANVQNLINVAITNLQNSLMVIINSKVDSTVYSTQITSIWNAIYVLQNVTPGSIITWLTSTATNLDGLCILKIVNGTSTYFVSTEAVLDGGITSTTYKSVLVADHIYTYAVCRYSQASIGDYREACITTCAYTYASFKINSAGTAIIAMP